MGCSFWPSGRRQHPLQTWARMCRHPLTSGRRQLSHRTPLSPHRDMLSPQSCLHSSRARWRGQMCRVSRWELCTCPTAEHRTLSSVRGGERQKKATDMTWPLILTLIFLSLPQALFGLASCSKAFLASAVGLLIDDFAQGRNVTPLPPGISRLDWSTKVADLLPDDWALADAWANKKASLRDVLGHVSGVPRHDYSYGPGDSLKDVVRRLQALRPAYELREKWSYNNQMYKLGAYLVAKYANSSYPAFAESRLFARMNMSATTFWPSEAARSGRVTQTWTKFGRRLPYWFTDEVADLMAGPGGVISSAEDMTKWLTVLINDGVDPITNETILPRSVFEETTSAHFVIKGTADTNTPEISLSGYGMGWMRWSYQGHELITHSGAIPGFSTKVAFLPTDKLGIVLLANADEKAAANEVIMYRIIEDVLRLRRVDRIISTDAQGRAVSGDGDSPGLPVTSDESKEGLALELEEYAGTYTNPGYGAFTLCAPTSDSHYCASVLADFAPFGNNMNGNLTAASSRLYGAWPRIWSSHLRMVHQEGESFSLQFTSLFPQGYGVNPVAFETWETGTSHGRAVFAVEDQAGQRKVKGFGLMIDDEAVKARERAGGGVEDVADAWFTKV
ncbi:hypothetical protein AcW1_002041 [Taiwanofungus camphoratus]|nr:hypothetical protein AcW1_002041 [Antrodia cinnamomea]